MLIYLNISLWERFFFLNLFRLILVISQQFYQMGIALNIVDLNHLRIADF